MYGFSLIDFFRLILDSKVSDEEFVFQNQFVTHVSNHTPLKRTYLGSKGKSLKIVSSDEDFDTSSDDDVQVIVRHHIPKNRSLDISNQEDTKEVKNSTTEIIHESNTNLERDKVLKNSEENSSQSESASIQEEPIGKIFGSIICNVFF